jgi:hypothetical protein
MERGNIAGIASQPGTLKGDATAGCRNGGHGDKPNILACGSQIMSPISGSGYFGFIFGGTGSGVFVLFDRRNRLKFSKGERVHRAASQ